MSLKYNVTQPAARENEPWDEKTVHRLKGGFNIVNFDQFALAGWLPKAIPLAIDYVARTATPIKGGVLHTAVAAGDTEMRLLKNISGNPLFAVGDFIGNATKAVLITQVDKSNGAYDRFVLSEAFGSAITVGGTVLSGTEAGANKIPKANAMNYAPVKWESGKQACTGVIQAYEVRNKFLPYPLTDTQKTELTSRFHVIP